jgi:hypothetical protein
MWCARYGERKAWSVERKEQDDAITIDSFPEAHLPTSFSSLKQKTRPHSEDELISWCHLDSPGPCEGGPRAPGVLVRSVTGIPGEFYLPRAFFSHLKSGEHRWYWRQVHTYSLINGKDYA